MGGYVHDGNREKSKSRLDLVFTLKESKTLKEFKMRKPWLANLTTLLKTY